MKIANNLFTIMIFLFMKQKKFRIQRKISPIFRNTSLSWRRSLLFVSLFHLYNSWTKIKIQNKDYLLNNIDFIETLGENQMWKAVKQLVINSISITLLSIAVFLLFLDKLLKSDSLFMLFLVMMLLFNGILWFFIKPKLHLKIKSDNEKIISKVDKFKKFLKNQL